MILSEEDELNCNIVTLTKLSVGFREKIMLISLSERAQLIIWRHGHRDLSQQMLILCSFDTD